MALRPQRQAAGQVEPIRKRLERLGVDLSIGAEPQTPAARAPIERTQTEIAVEFTLLVVFDGRQQELGSARHSRHTRVAY